LNAGLKLDEMFFGVVVSSYGAARDKLSAIATIQELFEIS
jgi:hypothetical protein